MIKLCMAGQSLIEHPMATEGQRGWAALSELFAASDVAFTNLELSIRGERGGWPMKDPDWCTKPHAGTLEVLESLGFNLLSLANNHGWDFGPTGLLDTIDAVERLGFKHAGTGVDLEAAAAPAIVDTPGGRVAMLAMAAGNLPPQAFATSTTRLGAFSRPGINPIVVRDVNLLPQAAFEGVAEVLQARDYRADAKGRYHIGDQCFGAGEHVTLSREIEHSDRRRHLQQITALAEEVDLLLVYLHQHHWEPQWQAVGEWMRDFARQCIDAGAGAFLGHGVPMLQPVEVYRGRPIFYGLGNFIFHPTAGPGFWLDRRCWRSAVIEGEFRDGRWVAVRFRPITLGEQSAHAGVAGSRYYPLPATGAAAAEILAELQSLSRPYGTVIEFDGDVGRLLLPDLLPPD